MNHELLDVQVGFRKGRRTRDQIANIHWIIEKAREFQKNFCFIDCAKVFDCVLSVCVGCSVMSDSVQLHGLLPEGSSVHEILQARILQWVAIPFSRGSFQCRD